MKMSFDLLDETSPVFFSGQFELFIVISVVVLLILVILFFQRKKRREQNK